MLQRLNKNYGTVNSRFIFGFLYDELPFVQRILIMNYFRDSAEFLFNVLRDPCLYSASTPVMVVCNKQDLGIQAKGAGAIERELAKEIGLLRVTQSRLLQDNSGAPNGNTNNISLGQEGKDFEFTDLRAEVKFCEAATTKDCNDEESGIPAIKQWIASIE